jgi:hypothetical protein
MQMIQPQAQFQVGVSSRSRPVVSLTTQIPQNEVEWVAIIKNGECDKFIKKLEDELHHDFSVENVDAEEKQFADLPRQIAKQRALLIDSEQRYREGSSLAPYREAVREARLRDYLSKHAGKRKRMTPEERDEAAQRKRAQKAAADDFIAPEDIQEA